MQWLARGEDELPDGLDWLTPLERARLDMLRYTKRRTEFLLRRWTAKQAVAAVTGLEPTTPNLARILVGNHPTGAPFVRLDGKPLDGDISVSDRAGWAVALLGRLDAVGIDLEIVEPRSDGFVADFLTEPEARYVRSLGSRAEQDAAANLYWSAKEAALKVLRTGLRADTRTVEVDPWPGVRDAARPDRVLADPHGRRPDGVRPDGWAPLAVRHTPSGAVFPGWWRIDGVFVLTMAVDASAPTGPAVIAEPPVLMPASADLTRAVPTHSWMANPLAW